MEIMDSSKSFLHTIKQIHHHRSYIVIAFQEIIPSVFVGCHYCCKAKNIGFAVVHENTTRLSILFLAVTTGLVPVLLIHCRPCPSFPSWCLKVPNISAVLNFMIDCINHLKGIESGSYSRLLRISTRAYLLQRYCIDNFSKVHAEC